MEFITYSSILSSWVFFIASFSLNTLPGTAGEADFTGISRSITFQPGQSGPISVEIDIEDDTLIEPTEAFQVALKDPSYPIQIGQPATVNILDNDGNKMLLHTVVFSSYINLFSL
jgi:hypothetical protein